MDSWSSDAVDSNIKSLRMRYSVARAPQCYGTEMVGRVTTVKCKVNREYLVVTTSNEHTNLRSDKLTFTNGLYVRGDS